MDLQTLTKAFQDAVQAQRLLRLGHLEDCNYADLKEAAKLSGECSGFKRSLGIFIDTANNLISNDPRMAPQGPTESSPMDTPLPALSAE
jgi:hypothetical protein